MTTSSHRFFFVPGYPHGGVPGLPAFLDLRYGRGALAVSTDPREILRNGNPLPLSPSEVALMALLVRRGRAERSAAGRAIAETGSHLDSLDILVHRIRRKFASMNAPDPIETRRGWGLMLRVEPDLHGATALWIGGAPAV